MPVIQDGYYTCTLSAGNDTLEKRFEKTFSAIGFADGQFASGRVFGDDLQVALNVIAANSASACEAPFELRLRYLGDNGTIAHVLIKAKLTASDGNAGMNLCCMDISGIMERKTELLRQNELKNLILNEINAGVWEWNFALKVEWWSDKFYEMLGIQKEEKQLTRESFLNEFVHPADRGQLEENIQKHLRTGDAFRIDIRIRKANEEYRWFETTGKIQPDDQGKPNRIVGTIIDKHERKMLRIQLERDEFLLNETGSLAKVGGWEYDLRDGSVAWTKEVYNLHELPLDLIPTYEVVKKLYDTESSQLLAAAVEACIREKKAYSLELVGLTGTGQRKWLRANGKPVTDLQGNVVFIRGTVQDIDEKKRKDLEFEQSMQIIHSQNQRLNNYAHIVSHNLRTHAGNIESILTMIGESEDPDEKALLMSHLYKISAGLNETIEHLNTVAKIQMDIQAARVKMRFADVFEKTVRLLLQNITEAEASIREDFSALPEIEYLPAYLESVMLNLLSNALKYRHPDRKPQIDVRTFAHEGRQYLEVTDNGAGIDLAKHGAKLFGMYKTFHRNPDAKGIGLFLTKNQVEALGGTIHVSSEPGVGSTFTIQF